MKVRAEGTGGENQHEKFTVHFFSTDFNTASMDCSGKDTFLYIYSHDLTGFKRRRQKVLKLSKSHVEFLTLDQKKFHLDFFMKNLTSE